MWGSVNEAYLLKNDGTLRYLGSYLEYMGLLPSVPTSPVKIADDVVQLSGGVILKSDGSAWILNDGAGGQIFRRVMDGVKQVSGSPTPGQYGFALKNDGTLWSWGSSNSPTMGRNVGEGYSQPGLVLDNVAYVSGTMAIRTDRGALYRKVNHL